MPSQDPSSQSTPIERLITLHDENIRLTETLKKVQFDFELLNLIMAVSKPRCKTIRKKYKVVMGLRLGVPQTLLESRLKRARKKFSDTRVALLREYQDLERTAEAAGESMSQVVDATLSGERASRTETLHTVLSHGRRITASTGDVDGELQIDESSNILQTIQSTQLPDDDVVVELNGKRLTQRGLALWYQTTNMKGDNRKLFEAKNVEINQMRRVRPRK